MKDKIEPERKDEQSKQDLNEELQHELNNGMKDQIEPERKDEQSKQDLKIPSSTNTTDMATKILPAKTVSIFSKVVLGLTDLLQLPTDTDCSAMHCHLISLYARPNDNWGVMSDTVFLIPVSYHTLVLL